MIVRKKLTETEIQQALSDLPAWKLENGQLCREFHFHDFAEAFSFMTKVSLLAESLNHHPDWRNVYQKVSISLSTHDLGGLSTLDIELARRISQLLSDNQN